MVSVICARRSSNGSYTVVETAGGVPTDDVPLVGDRPKREISDYPVTSLSVEAVSWVACRLKWSRRATDGMQPTHCLDHAPLEDSLGKNVKMAGSKGGFISLSSFDLRMHPSDDGGGGGSVPNGPNTGYIADI